VKLRHRRVLARWAQAAYQASERRVSRLVLIQRSTLRYRGHRDQQEGLRMRLRELAATWGRFGYRRLTVLLKRRGVAGERETHLPLVFRGRLNRANYNKYRRKTASRSRVLQGLAMAPNQRWSMDFVSDRLVDDRWFRVFIESRYSVELH
jgi:putative transposase